MFLCIRLQNFILCLQLWGLLLERKLTLPWGSSLKSVSSYSYLKFQGLWMTGYIQLSQTEQGSSCTFVWNLLVCFVWTSLTRIHTIISSRGGTVCRQKHYFRWVTIFRTPLSSLLNLLITAFLFVMLPYLAGPSQPAQLSRGTTEELWTGLFPGPCSPARDHCFLKVLLEYFQSCIIFLNL